MTQMQKQRADDSTPPRAHPATRDELLAAFRSLVDEAMKALHSSADPGMSRDEVTLRVLQTPEGAAAAARIVALPAAEPCTIGKAETEKEMVRLCKKFCGALTASTAVELAKSQAGLPISLVLAAEIAAGELGERQQDPFLTPPQASAKFRKSQRGRFLHEMAEGPGANLPLRGFADLYGAEQFAHRIWALSGGHGEPPSDF